MGSNVDEFMLFNEAIPRFDEELSVKYLFNISVTYYEVIFRNVKSGIAYEMGYSIELFLQDL